MESTLQLGEKKRIFGIPQYEFTLLLIVHICALFTFVSTPAVRMCLGFVAIGCTCLLAFNPYLYLLLPVYMIFYEQIVPIGGLVGYRIYTLIVITSCIFEKKSKITFKNVLMWLFLMGYTFFVIYPHKQTLLVMCLINFTFLILYFDNYLKYPENYKKFFGFFVLAIVFSAAYGLFSPEQVVESSMLEVDGKYVEYGRFLATFNDPNYLGLMFNIAIFSNICLGYTKTKMGKLALAICYISLLATLSITAIIVNIIGLVFYFVVVKNLNPIVIPLMAITVIAFVGIYNYSLENDMGFVTGFSYRIEGKLNAFENRDMDAVTTNRTALSKKNLNYFFEQNVVKVLFGGNFISSIGLDDSKFKTLSHNELVDNLLFFGVVGTIIYWLYFYVRMRQVLSKTHQENNVRYAIIMVKLLYLVYCFTLTIFPDIRLMFLFFL